MARLQIGLVFVCFAIFGILFFILPKNEISEYEKRKLTEFPKFSYESLWTGEFTRNIEAYIADHFTYRDFFVETAFSLKKYYGIESEVTLIATQDNENLLKTDTLELEKILTDTLVESIDSSSVATSDTTANKTENTGEKVDGLLIWEGRAYQVFGGNDRMAKYFARSVNRYQREMSKLGARFHCLVIPSPAAFYIPEKYKKMFSNERRNIDTMYNNFDTAVFNTDVYKIFEQHKDEYLYFNTDHHWTGLGAYYAYEGFCKTANLKPMNKDSMQRKVIPKFLGSLYLQTQNQELREHVDSVVYFKSKLKTKTTAWVHSVDDKPIRASVLAERARRSAAYSVFLGSDYALMKIETPLKNGKRAVLIKNSFGNAFAPNLIHHFEKVFVVDYRYFDGNLTELIKEHKITDVILLQNNFGANTSWHIKKTLRIINPPAKKVKPNPRDSTNQTIDSTKNN